VFAKQRKEILGMHFTLIESDISLYLANRIKFPLDLDTSVSNKFNQMLLYLGTELHLDTIDQRDECSATLQQNLIKLFGPLGTLDVLWWGLSSSPAWNSKALSVLEKAFAAISADAYELVRTLISSTSVDNKLSVFSHCAHEPLGMAITLQKSSMVDVILSDTTRPWSGSPQCWIAENMCLAIQLRASQPILKSLIEAREKHGSPTKKEYENWLALAIYTGSVRIVKVALNIKIRRKVRVTRRHLIKACTCGRPEVVTALLGKDLMDPNRKFVDTTPLIAAARSGHVDVVKAVLDAGANINVSVIKEPHTPLKAALQHRSKKDAVIELLIARGAIIPDPEHWPRKENIWNTLRKARIAQGGSSVVKMLGKDKITRKDWS
jgi:hypothetical protein